jgi:hypothetical protein
MSQTPSNQSPQSFSFANRKIAWPIFWVLWFGVPWFNGWFFASRIECTTCFRDVLVHCLAFFGYVVLGGFIFSLSKPTRERQTEVERSSQPHGYMLGTREDVLLSAVLLGAVFAVTWFFSIFKF